MTKKYYLMMCVWCMTVFTVHPAQRTPQRLSTWFNKQAHEDVVTREYSLEQPGTLTVTNPYGTITIKAEWNQNSIIASAKKRSPSLEHLGSIRIDEQRTGKHDLALSVVLPANKELAKKDMPTVNLDIVVPVKTQLKLATTHGAIVTDNVHGNVWATTTRGPITLDNTKGMIVAETHDNAHIKITQAQGNVKATTLKGGIHIHDAKGSIMASTEKGPIEIHCKHVPAIGKVCAHAGTGNIHVHLPTNTNAELQARTDRGCVMSDHLITVKPFTTQWNRQTWKKIRKEVYGTLGTGEAQIDLRCRSGNITIAKK